MKKSFFENIQKQVNHNSKKNILNYAKMEVLCVRSVLLNNDNILVTVYKTQQPKKKNCGNHIWAFYLIL